MPPTVFEAMPRSWFIPDEAWYKYVRKGGNELKTLALVILKELAGAYWDGKELVLTVDGAVSLAAKIEIKSLKSSSGAYESNHRLSYKPKLHTNESTKHGYKTVQDFPKTTSIDEIRAVGEEHALYAALYPTFLANTTRNKSYSEYVSSKDIFLEDFRKFSQLPEAALIDYAKNKGVDPAGMGIHQYLLRAMYVTHTLHTSLREIINAVSTAKGANMAGESRRSAALRMTKQALVMGTVTAANKQVIRMAVDSLGDKAPAILQTEGGQHALQILLPFVLMNIADLDFTGKYIPDNIRKQFLFVCEQAFQGALAQGTEAFASEVFGLLGPLITEYTRAAEMVELPDGGELDLDSMPLGAHTERMRETVRSM